jgi:Flp pilus assembly protein TadG
VLTFAALVLFAGLIVDAGRVLHANAHASDLAGKAARVGAQELDPASIRTGLPRLEPAAAEAAARRYLAEHDLRGAVAATGEAVTVTVSWHVDYWLIAALRPGGATVTQSRVAVPITGP